MFIFAQQPKGFVDELISDDWTAPVGLTFDANGRMYVWEKPGTVHIVENGVKSSTPLIDISEEVLDYLDHGLNGLALDPNFLTNGYIYLMFVVDRNYIDTYGTANYSTTNNDKFEKATIGRIVRYTINKNDGFKSIVSGSRLVLLGNSLSTGIPIVMDNHGVGSLVFAPDGSLLFSVGDVAFVGNDETEPFFQEAQKDGILTVQTRVSTYRSQLKTSLNGKINRINPATGQGYPSNPFYNASKPTAPESMVWCLGLRNPFRFTIKPNTGSKNTADGNVGTLYIGDVGWASREELNVAPQKGMNFGWPAYEGDLTTTMNNPMYLPQNPEKPKVVWRGPVAQAYINKEFYDVGTPQFLGENFTGASSIGGLWYTGTAYPEAFRNVYFHGDYTAPGWIKSFRFDVNNQASEVVRFFENIHPTCFAVHPKNQFIYYINYEFPYTNQLRCIVYDPNYNMPPLVKASANSTVGGSPLTVTFSSEGTTDPENGELSYFWDFGDGNTSTSPNPTHTFYSDSPSIIYVKLTVTDNLGKATATTLAISINNNAPNIQSTSIDFLDYFPNVDNEKLYLSALADDEDGPNGLIYDWRLVLHHEDHVHSVGNTYGKQANMKIEKLPCDGQRYFYEVVLRVIDRFGVATNRSKNIYSSCEKLEKNPPESFGIWASSVAETSLKLEWPAVVDDTEIWGYEIFRNEVSEGIVAAQTHSFDFTNVVFKSTNRYKVRAIDKYGNSTFSETLVIKNNPSCATNSVYISEIDWANSSNGIGAAERNMSNGTANANDGLMINILGKTYNKGVGVFPFSTISINPSAQILRFKADVGLQFNRSSTTCGSVVFKVNKNGSTIYNSNVVRVSGKESIDLDISNASQLELQVEDSGDNNYCDEGNWANALLSSCQSIDKQSPSIVKNIVLNVDSVTHTHTLTWDKANDNDAITYTIYIDSDSISTVSTNKLVLKNISKGVHAVAIQATDVNNNASVSSEKQVELKEIIPPDPTDPTDPKDSVLADSPFVIHQFPEAKDILSLQIYPNPTSNDVLIKMALRIAAKAEIRVLSSNGSVLIFQPSSTDKTAYEWHFDTSNWVVGTYHILISAGQDTISEKLLKR